MTPALPWVTYANAYISKKEVFLISIVSCISLGYYDPGCAFEILGVLMPDEMQLTRRDKNILSSKLAGLINRTSN